VKEVKEELRSDGRRRGEAVRCEEKS